jgi:hypothetical protein
MGSATGVGAITGEAAPGVYAVAGHWSGREGKTLKMTKIVCRSAVLAAGAGVMVALNCGVANAGQGYLATWDATGTPADVVGAHGWGRISRGFSADSLEFNASAKDTASDSHGARVYVRLVANGEAGDVYTNTQHVDASGDGTTNTSDWIVDWSSVTGGSQQVLVKECLTEQGSDYQCGSWTQVYSQ